MAALPGIEPARVAAQDEPQARIVGGEPLTWDPARAGETTSVGVLAQVFETLTAFDAENQIRPALARSWSVAPDGRRIEFELRPEAQFSDGSPITGQDVVDSWFRLLDPARPSPLVSLLSDVRGANDYLVGSAGRDAVGLRAEGNRVIVELRRPASYFLAVTGSPSLAVVPRQMWDVLDTPLMPSGMVVSGAYLPTAQTDAGIRLEANPRYWAGPPALAAVQIVTDLGGVGAVSAFERGDVDYVQIGSWDASWIRYDRQLGPQLREVSDFVVHYYGFDTTRPPFDDGRVRLAFAQAVDWERLAMLDDREPAMSMVPPGIPGGGDEDFKPPYDPDAARQLLADAGYPDGEGFPEVPLVTHGYGLEVAVATQLERELGISVPIEFREFGDYLELRRTDDRAHFWNVAWSADYPHAHDFLGLLLETGSASNEGQWSNAEYDALIAEAAATEDPDEQLRIYARAQAILRSEAPVVPVEYSSGWALSRNGLLGADPSGVGYIRFAGLAWAEDSGR
ncbi:MAG TPA: peptide ABC transporter substrate-binding protein [Candidatus Limnocylindrales bacterium]|nr:peptide ABC transporter substrate-binding protein [Candidatus Limnocylindrales bacterium]